MTVLCVPSSFDSGFFFLIALIKVLVRSTEVQGFALGGTGAAVPSASRRRRNDFKDFALNDKARNWP